MHKTCTDSTIVVFHLYANFADDDGKTEIHLKTYDDLSEALESLGMLLSTMIKIGAVEKIKSISIMPEIISDIIPDTSER